MKNPDDIYAILCGTLLSVVSSLIQFSGQIAMAFILGAVGAMGAMVGRTLLKKAYNKYIRKNDE